MDIHEHLADMRALVASRDWDGLESEYRARAVELTGDLQTDRIAGLDFASYQARLEPCVADALTVANRCGAIAVYFEYDLDNDWQSGFFLCGEYNPESAGDEDWACDWIEDFSGPEFPDASDIYCENHFDRTPMAKGSTLYLVARTVSTFGRCLDLCRPSNVTVCMGFHDQDPVLRLVEAI